MKLTFLFLVILTAFTTLKAQFTNSQKDSVLAYIGYPTAQYSLKLNFSSGNYIKFKETELEKLSSTELNKLLKNEYKDAEIYRALFFKEENPEKKYEYFVKAVNNFNDWINEEPQNEDIVEKAMGLAYNYNSADLLGRFVNFALPNFPNNLKIIQYSSYFYMEIQRDYVQAEKVIEQGLNLDKYNLELLSFKSLLKQYVFITNLQKDPNQNYEIDMSFVDDILKANANKIEYIHFNYFCKAMKIYMLEMQKLFKMKDIPENPFSVIKLSASDKKILKDFESFANAEIKKNGKNKSNLLSTLGFIQCMMMDLKSAANNYQLFYNETKSLESIETMVLIGFLNQNWAICEKYLELCIKEKKNNALDYGSLMKLYRKYLKNYEKEKLVFEKILKLETEDINKSEILIVWYLKNKNTSKAEELISLNEVNLNVEYLNWYKLAINVLKDKKEDAKTNLNSILKENPEDEDALKLKKILDM